MASFNPRIFTNPDRLKSISATHLLTFLSKWKEYFASRGVFLPDEANEDFPYDTIAQVLMDSNDHVPVEMVDALYYVHETATNETAAELLEIVHHAGLTLDAREEPSNADIAVQIWLQRPELLQRQHAETVAFQRSNFMYFAGSRPSNKPPELPTITDAIAKTIQDRMNNWFQAKRRGRNSRVFAFPRGEKIWLLVRHGMPTRREGKHQDDGENGIAVYRPQQHDVLIYDSETDEIGVNAGTKGERDLYLETFGEVLFGSEDYFDSSERYTLDPLRELGPASMAHGDIEGIAGVRFVEFGRRWPGKISVMEIRKCEDLFKAYGEDWKERLAGGSFVNQH